MPDHKEQPASALAHGAAKCSDIERVRREVNRAEVRVADDDRAVAHVASGESATVRRRARETRSLKPADRSAVLWKPFRSAAPLRTAWPK